MDRILIFFNHRGYVDKKKIKEAKSLMKINVPEKVEYIIDVLMKHGYEAYAVGGCIRDSILGREPGDWDITTSASPYEVKELFKRTIDTGIQHGTVTVMLDKEGFEVTTYRLDGEYEDCRHPKQVEFTKSLEEDLKRRDFTINAMAYNEADGMVDLFEGLEDIKKRRIRCVGNAMDRFEEDALRILRAIRFSAQIDFEIEEETKRAITMKAKNLVNISAERIREELNKIFLSKHPERLDIAYQAGITEYVLPEFDQKKKESTKNEEYKTYGDLCLQMLNEVSRFGEKPQMLFGLSSRNKEERNLTNKERIALSYAILLANDNEKVMNFGWNVCEETANAAKKVMQRLRFDNDTVACVSKLVKYSCTCIENDDISLRRAMSEMGIELMDLWFLFQRVRLYTFASQEQKIQQEYLESLYRRYEWIMESGHCVNLKEMKINGKDLIQLGCEPGVRLGELLKDLLDCVIEKPENNSKERLIQLAKERI